MKSVLKAAAALLCIPAISSPVLAQDGVPAIHISLQQSTGNFQGVRWSFGANGANSIDAAEMRGSESGWVKLNAQASGANIFVDLNHEVGGQILYGSCRLDLAQSSTASVRWDMNVEGNVFGGDAPLDTARSTPDTRFYHFATPVLSRGAETPRLILKVLNSDQAEWTFFSCDVQMLSPGSRS